MDPVEEMLINKYGISPEDAYNMALDIKHGGARTGNENDSTNKMVKQEAYTDVANKATDHLTRMAHNAREFTRMHEAKQRGEALPEKDEWWYNLVVNKQKERYANAASLRTAQMKGVAGQGALDSQMRGNQMAAPAFQGINNTNRMVDQAMGAQAVQRDQIAQQLIPMPQGMNMQTAEAMQQPLDQGMSPGITAYLKQMGAIK